MGLLRWFTKNWANTHEPTHADLAPLVLALTPADALSRVKQAVTTLPRWNIEAETAGQLRLTRRTRVIRFVDDITLRFEPTDGGCQIQAESRSRVGKGDLGQNRRNILELFRAIQGAL